MKNIIYLIAVFSLLSCNGIGQTKQKTESQHTTPMSNKVEKSKEEWKKVLSPEQFNILREKGTEMPYSGKYYLHSEKGIYVCAACGNELFKSDTKFNAGCGWPSFSDVIDSSKVVYTQDKTLGMDRTEITCAKCGGHLGHVFNDGPAPTGLRYCINSVSIGFKK
jgi:peptide-methionine (R)-S-oxide reductase